MFALDVSIVDAPANRRITQMADVIQERGPQSPGKIRWSLSAISFCPPMIHSQNPHRNRRPLDFLFCGHKFSWADRDLAAVWVAAELWLVWSEKPDLLPTHF